MLMILPVFFIIQSCSLGPVDANDGLIWQKDLQYPPCAGTEIHSDNLYFADESGTIYSCWIDSGLIKWKRRLNNESVRMIFITGSGLGVISGQQGGAAKTSTFRIYNFERGICVFITNLPWAIRDSYFSDGTNIIVHWPSGAAVLNGDGTKIDPYDLTQYATNIVTFAAWEGYYYAIEGNSSIIKFDRSMHPVRTFDSFTGSGYSGDFAYDNGRIYISTTGGVKALDTVKWDPVDIDNGTDPVLFNGASAGLVKRQSGPEDKYLLYSSMSFRIPPRGNSYSPLVQSGSLGIAAYIDPKGFINVVDSRTGYFVYSKFIGMIDRPFLKVSSDYLSKSVFIPLSSPAKIFCYSLKFAASQKMPGLPFK
jgi:hypothetical protein